MPTILPPKKDVALALLERASVFIHLDPRDPSVQVPSWFKRQPQLVLQVGLNMLVRIPDLDVGEDAIACTLSFNRAPHYCYVPWRAVYALVGEDGRGMVWPEDIPPEVPAQGAESIAGASPRPRLHSVPRDSAAHADSAAPSSRAPNSAVPASQGAASRGPASQNPASAAPSRRAQFRGAGEHDSASARSSRSPSLFPPPPDSKATSQGNARGTRADAKQEGPPVLALSGSKRRRANAERRSGDSRAPVSSDPSSSSPLGSSSLGVSGESDSAASLRPGATVEPGERSSASSSDSQRAPVSSGDSQERSTRSSERPYLRLVR